MSDKSQTNKTQDITWKNTPDRGSLWLIELIAWIILKFGRGVGRAFLYPIVTYFILFSSTTKFSREYLARSLTRPVTIIDLFKHYYSFANMLLDRVYILSGKTDSFDITIHNAEVVHELNNSNKGAILLGSHLGNFDLLRVVAKSFSTKTKALINVDNSQKINIIFEKLNPEFKNDIIQIGTLGAMLEVKESVQDGYIVGILADRVEAKNRSVECDFLGKKALFPTGPILLANILKVPIIICFGLHQGKNQYHIHFYTFCEQINLSSNKLIREQQLHEYVQKYVKTLEQHCIKTPYNWFNFFDIWNNDVT